MGTLVQKLAATAPLITIALVSFNFAVVYQEFHRGVAARRKNASEGFLTAFATLVRKSRRRYGGYIVHMGIGLMYLGFCGKAWELEKEASLLPGQSAEVGGYELTYKGSRREVDQEKQMIFADMDVKRGDKVLSQVHPAKFIYNESSMGPTTEVSQINGLRDDLYVVVGSIDPGNQNRATFRIHVNPLVAWIWIGVLVLILGTTVSLWPEVSLREVSAWSYMRAGAGAASGIMLAILIASTPAVASESTHERSRERAVSVSPSASPIVPPADVSLGGVGGRGGLALLGGLMLGALAALGTRRVRPEPIQQ
jgi:cytochrome c-type biogenesis protein CcmF